MKTLIATAIALTSTAAYANDYLAQSNDFFHKEEIAFVEYVEDEVHTSIEQAELFITSIVNAESAKVSATDNALNSINISGIGIGIGVAGNETAAAGAFKHGLNSNLSITGSGSLSTTTGITIGLGLGYSF